MTSSEVTRRGAIRLIGGGAAAAALAYTLGTERGADASTSQELAGMAPFGVVGLVVSASADQLVVATRRATIRVLRGERTRAYAGVAGKVSDLAAFVPGDRVFVEGTRSSASGTVHASTVSSVFQPVEVRVNRVDQSGHAATTIGRVDLRGHLPDLRGAGHSLKAGAVVSGYTWSNPASGETYLLVPDH